MSDSALVLLLLLLILAWIGFCRLANRWVAPDPQPVVSDPGREAIRAATGPCPPPTGRHRDPSSPLLPYTARPRHVAEEDC